VIKIQLSADEGLTLNTIITIIGILVQTMLSTLFLK